MKSPSRNFWRDNFSKDRDGLRRRKLCFTFQEPRVLGNKCVKDKEHYIEVFSKRKGQDQEEELPIDLEVAYETLDKEPSSKVKKIVVLS